MQTAYEEKFKRISAAYEVLADKEKKQLYDDIRVANGKERARTQESWSYTHDKSSGEFHRRGGPAAG